MGWTGPQVIIRACDSFSDNSTTVKSSLARKKPLQYANKTQTILFENISLIKAYYIGTHDNGNTFIVLNYRCHIHAFSKNVKLQKVWPYFFEDIFLLKQKIFNRLELKRTKRCSKTNVLMEKCIRYCTVITTKSFENTVKDW